MATILYNNPADIYSERMAASVDPSDFRDVEYEAARRAGRVGVASLAGEAARAAPSREEVTAQITDVQAELARLKQEQEKLERERTELAEVSRRQAEWQTGRQEMVQHLTRGLGLLEEAEFAARQDAEQMAKSAAGLREAMAKLQAISEATWTADNFTVELTRALTTLENARMEWNSARLKHPRLDGQPAAALPASTPPPAAEPFNLSQMSFLELCRLGVALTWPLALGLLLVAVIALVKLR